MNCDIIIPVWNEPEATRSCLEYLRVNTRYPYRVIVIDNGSASETSAYLDEIKRGPGWKVEVIRNDKNVGFIKAVNQGLAVSNADYVCVLNNDTLPGEGWLTELVMFMEKHPDTGLANPLSGGHLAEGLTVNEYARKIKISNKGRYMEMNQCQGFCMLIKRELIEKIGYLDERFGMGGFDDTDYSMRAYLAGYGSVCVYSSYVYHKEHRSFDRLGDRKKIQSKPETEYYKKWPRHRRIALFFSVSDKTSERELENLLNSAVFLARGWCWVNLFIFGPRNAKDKTNCAKNSINLPLHQNIKFNYPGNCLMAINMVLRILERSFGRKSRKKYDTVICDRKISDAFLKMLCGLKRMPIFYLDFSRFPEEKLAGIIPVAARKTSPKCDIILPVCDEFEITKKCIESIVKNTSTPYRLIIIDNGRDSRLAEFMDELGRDKKVDVTVVRNKENIGWVRALNKGMELSESPFLCFQNNDTVVTEGWLGKMIGILLLRDNFGMINPVWEGKPPRVSFEAFNRFLEARAKKRFVETDWCRGFSVVLKREVVEKIGFMDEAYGLGYLDDVDYSVRAIEAGYLCLRALNTYVYHQRNVTAARVFNEKWDEVHNRNKLIFHRKWGRALKIVVVLERSVCKNSEMMDGVEEAIFYLARKQHHIDIWSARNFADRFQHTNIKIRVYPYPFMRLASAFNLYMNGKKKPEKRYDIVLYTASLKNGTDFKKFAMESADRLKEKTRDIANAEV
ncbi:MAG: glycosyltransferase [Candidatus Omnitrophica bacterium]|nr:glycosyltransferase [Candidatus Omnitrophota bacterium]